jgi:hypothetical protein
MSDLAARVHGLLDEVTAAVAPVGRTADVDAIRRRVDEPLRVAIAGRVKAGKSTLLNALVGERLAPTDAGECTRIVTWYREGLSYEVGALLQDGSWRPLRFGRDEGALQIELEGLAVGDVDRLDVAWPAVALRDMTLVDTPGLGSVDDTTSSRTRDFFAVEDTSTAAADAVVYLMRHLHRDDAAFLEAFTDGSVAGASPVNAVAVLSRADEIGVGRLDAMESAQRIAARLVRDERLHALCSAVVPVAGLVAETAASLRESELSLLRELATEPVEVLRAMLLSPDRFCDPAVSSVAPELRRELVTRLGMFGLRWALTELRAGRVVTSADLSRSLTEVSGIGALRRLLREHFAGRAAALKARSALSSLRALGRDVSAADPAAGATIEAAVERAELSWPELADLRLAHLVLSGAARLSAQQAEEALRVIGTGPATHRVGLTDGVSPDVLRAALVEGVERWRTAAASPLADPVTVEACELIARAYESLHAASAAH